MKRPRNAFIGGLINPRDLETGGVKMQSLDNFRV